MFKKVTYDNNSKKINYETLYYEHGYSLQTI